MKYVYVSVFAALLWSIQPAWSASTGAVVKDDEVVLVKNSLTTVTKADFYTELRRLPAEYRGGVETSAQRIQKIVDNILMSKSLAAEARMLKIDSEPEIQRMFNWLKEKGLAQIRLERLDEDATATFKAKEADYEQRAQEIYKTNTAKYTEPATVTVSHVLISLDHRSREDALKRAEEVYKLALEGTAFTELVAQYSDDPSSKQNNGNLGNFGPGKMVKPFEDVAFALDKPGAISTPVETPFGFHIIRLESKRAARLKAYEEVRGSIMEELRIKYVSDIRAEHMHKIDDDNATTVNQEAIDSLKKSVNFKEVKPDAAK